MSAVNASKQQQETPTSLRGILAPLVGLIIGLFMVVLDGTAVNVAIPGFVKEFDSTLSVVQWTVTGYALAQAAVIPLAGWLSDRFGAKRIFLISVALFTIGSGLCALATSSSELILYRIIQGMGGGMVMPVAMAYTYRLAPPGKVGAVMGMMGIPILLAPALGPVLAGWFIDFASWEWLFLVNLPIGVIGIIIGALTLPKIERQSVAVLDMFGILLGPLAFAALSYGVSEGGTSWSSTKTLAGLSIGVVALVLFIVAELRHKNPLLELRVFKSFEFTKGIVIQWVSQIALFGTMFLVPLFLQSAKQFTAFETGLTMLPQALAAAIFMPIGGALFDRIGARWLVVSGMAIVTGAAFMFSNIQATDGVSMMIAPLAMLGAGMGLFMMALNTHLIQAAPQNLVSRVTSLTNAAQQVMTSFAVAGLTTILSTRLKDVMATGTVSPVDAAADAFGYTFFILVGIAVGGGLLGFLLRNPKVNAEGGDKPAEAHMMMG